MKVLILGSGGREHALAWKIASSPLCQALFIAPGNPGTAGCGQNVDLEPLDFPAVHQFCIQENIHVLLVGPEEPLVRGITDFLRSQSDLKDFIICGPDSVGAQLEGSKAYAKAFMADFGIPTARYGEFRKHQIEEAIAFLDGFTPPYVIKADGLAAGKGVIICQEKDEAIQAIRDMFDGEFGTAGHTIVLEEFLDGIEFSVFALTDGEHACILPVAKDYKRIGEGDTGPNTGGMGAVSPVSFVDPQMMDKVMKRIVIPTINGLTTRQINYQGFIFFGLIAVKGEPMVIEYNCRMGDPETEVVMPRLTNDLLQMLVAMHERKLDTITIEFDPRTAVTVMLVSGGYPGSYPKGLPVLGADTTSPDHTLLFHAGTRLINDQLVTNGGRVMACTGMGDDLREAQRRAYARVGEICFDQMNFRRDIGRDLE